MGIGGVPKYAFIFTGRLGRGGEAPGGRDAGKGREGAEGKGLVMSELLLGSEGKTCQCSSSDGVVR